MYLLFSASWLQRFGGGIFTNLVYGKKLTITLAGLKNVCSKLQVGWVHWIVPSFESLNKFASSSSFHISPSIGLAKEEEDNCCLPRGSKICSKFCSKIFFKVSLKIKCYLVFNNEVLFGSVAVAQLSTMWLIIKKLWV